MDINLSNKKILVTGGAGFIGSNLCEELLIRKNKVVCFDNFSTGKKDAHIIQLNRETYNAPKLKKILSDKNISKIFHYARADLLFIKKYLKINVENVHCTKLMSKLA